MLRILLLLLLALPLASCLGGGSGGSNKVSVSENGLKEDPPSKAPKAKAGKDQYVMGGGTVTLDGSKSSDPEDDPLSFLWKQSGGPKVALPD